MTEGKPFAVLEACVCLRCGCFASQHLPSGPVPGLRPCAGGCVPQCPDLQLASELEQVDHPSHYGGEDDPYEAIRIIEALGWGEGFNKGNALKYLLRAGKKAAQPEPLDLKKAAWYLTREIGRLEQDA